MPRKIQDFAQQSLVKPVLVNVGRAGAANLDVLQVVEYVKQEAKMVYLLECLQKTPPPVIIFSENKNEVDGLSIVVLVVIAYIHLVISCDLDIQEYLLFRYVRYWKGMLLSISTSLLLDTDHLGTDKVALVDFLPSQPRQRGFSFRPLQLAMVQQIRFQVSAFHIPWWPGHGTVRARIHR